MQDSINMGRPKSSDKIEQLKYVCFDRSYHGVHLCVCLRIGMPINNYSIFFMLLFSEALNLKCSSFSINYLGKIIRGKIIVKKNVETNISA